MIVFDSYAWLEYFAGSVKGKLVKELIESKEEILTPAICLAEIKRKYLKEKKEFSSRIKFIMLRSKIISINSEMALLAAELAYQHKLYMIDAVVYACSKAISVKILTGDKHFKGLPGVEML